MKVFVYEWVCGGGFLGRSESPPQSLQVEAWAMLSAVLGDLSAMPDVEAVTLVAPEFPERLRSAMTAIVVRDAAGREQAFDQAVESADATMLIAPEFDGLLLSLAQRVEQLGGKLLSPAADFVEIASDKQSTCERLHQAGIKTPRGGVLMAGERMRAGMNFPLVLKPIAGCGSLGVTLVREPGFAPTDSPIYRCEEYVEGQAASVAIVCSGEHRQVLEPCWQRLNQPEGFAYLGGALPMPEALAERARRLALSAVEALPPTTGYVGVDMVLGAAEDGSQDVVLEVNPRLTTSYVGLRAATSANLMELLVAMVDCGKTEAPPFDRSVEWTADGQVDVLPTESLR